MEDLTKYIDGKYTLHPNWEKQVLNRNTEIKLSHDSRLFSLDVVRRLRNYFDNISIDCIQTPLETENIIDQECEEYYVFSNCRDTNPQKLVVDAKLAGNDDLILFFDADDEVRISEITIGEHGCFDAVVRNYWQNCKDDNEEKYGNYSLVSHVETLIIQNNPGAVRDFDRYVSGDYKVRSRDWKVKELRKNIIVRINGVKNLDEQINRLKEYFGYIFVDDRKTLGNQHREAIANIQLDSNKIQQ